MHYINKFYLLLILIFIFSCNDDNQNEQTTELNYYDKGIIVVNEGNFGQSNGSLTLITGFPDSVVVIQDIVAKANNGLVTGDVVQSVIQHENRLFVAVNNDSKILVLNSGTFVQEAVIESDISLPRYMAVAFDRLFVTNWNEDFTSSFVSVFKLSDLKLNWKIQTDPGTEKIIIDSDENVWVTNNFSNTVQFFRSNSQLVEKTIEVGESPSGIMDIGNIIVLCQGSFGGSNGSLYKIDKESHEVIDSISFQYNLGDDIFGAGVFYSGNVLYSANLNNDFSQLQPWEWDLSNEVTYLYGIGQASFAFGILDAKNFDSPGEILVFDNTQNLLLKAPVGIGPNSIVNFEN